MASRTSARFSTYSGAPSIQPSLAPTFETQPASSSNRSSTQPIMAANRTSTNTNTYLSPTRPLSEKSGTMYGNAATTASTATLAASDPKSADLKSWSGVLDRMQDERLDRQRYVLSDNKSEEVSKLALGAKVERALSRRMVGQDASFSKKPYSEKRNLEVKAN